MHLPGIAGPNADPNKLVKDALGRDDFGSWLMIVDNADDPAVLLGTAGDDPRRVYPQLSLHAVAMSLCL